MGSFRTHEAQGTVCKTLSLHDQIPSNAPDSTASVSMPNPMAMGRWLLLLSSFAAITNDPFDAIDLAGFSGTWSTLRFCSTFLSAFINVDAMFIADGTHCYLAFPKAPVTQHILVRATADIEAGAYMFESFSIWLRIRYV